MMGSNPKPTELTSDMKTSDNPQNRNVFSGSSADELASQDSHQPMYRKRVTKPGQKEKRLVNKKNVPTSSPHQRQSRRAANNNNNKGGRDSNPKSDRAKSSSRPSSSPSSPANGKQNGGGSSGGSLKKKTKKETSGKKKKKSTLAFWFCMSANADPSDRQSQAPIPKPAKSPKPISAPDYEVPDKKDNSGPIARGDNNPEEIRSISEEMPTRILTTKHSRRNACKRYSAPESSDWTTIVTKAIVESPPQTPRSRTPTRGVRYRYDGTLERPYVYPGGLTFNSGDKSKRNDDSYYHANTSFCDSQMSDRSHIDAGCDQYDPQHVRKKFYLTYDLDLTNSSHPKDRRYSLPPGFVNEEDSLTTNQTQPHGKQNDHSVTSDASTRHDVIYDVPYESDKEAEDKKATIRTDTQEKRNSYYSTPLQNSGCIYMWHSCEDLKHCKEKYHSKDGLNRICATGDETESSKSYADDIDQVSTASISARSSTKSSRSSGHSRNKSLPVELTYEFSTNTKSTDVVQKREENPSILHRNNAPPTNGSELEDGRAFTSHTDAPLERAHHRNVRNAISLSFDHPAERADDNDNPFSRQNMIRSSCMPSNKRFFLPPPPCYTPPKEDMEAARPFMSRANRNNCGSQTDLTEDVVLVDIPMEDRDLSLKREPTSPKSPTKSPGADNSIHAQATKTDENVTLETGHTIVCSNQTQTAPFINNNSHSQAQETNNSKNSNFDTRRDSRKSHKLKHTQSAITSTPKPSRRLFPENSEMKLYNSFPKPAPRKRIRNKDSTSSSFSTTEADSNVQSVRIDTGPPLTLPKPTLRPKPSNKVPPPVPKKRRSQMIEAESIYTTADIDKGLAASCDEGTPSSTFGHKANDDRRGKFPAANGQACDLGNHNVNNTPTSVLTRSLGQQLPNDTNFRRNLNNNNNNNNNNNADGIDNNLRQSFSTLERGLVMKMFPDIARKQNNNNSPSNYKIGTTSTSHDLTSSPGRTSHNLTSSSGRTTHDLTSSPGRTSHDLTSSSGRRRASGPSPTVDAIAHDFQRMSYDSDNEDENCNADDEMSVHNEDIDISKSVSVQNLLRSRSIFDRSLAVTRKRRQRMRGRKCQSQLLSSADLDQYDDEMTRLKLRHHLWKQEMAAWEKGLRPESLDWHQKAELFQREKGLPSSPILREPHLWKHSYTDSGNDSDMWSPIDSRHLHHHHQHQHHQQPYHQHHQHHQHHHQFVNVFDEPYYTVSHPRGDTTTNVDKKDWELRLREKHQLRKARSIEHLFLVQEISGNKAVQKPSLETCV